MLRFCLFSRLHQKAMCYGYSPFYIYVRSKLQFILRRFPPGPMQDVGPLTMYQDGVYVSGELWDFWRDTFPQPSVYEMWAFVMDDIDDEHAGFVGSLA